MISTKLSDVAAACDGTLGVNGAEPAAEMLVTGVSTDNRSIKPGDLFVAIKGERVDGNKFSGAAFDAGASAVLTANAEAALDGGADPARIIVVDEPIAALGKLAQAALVKVRAEGNPQLRVVAVTGSVGKTTTKDLLAALLASRGPIIAPPGSFNNELGLPLTVLRADATTATLVLEMGADHIGNLEYLTTIAPPDVSVVLAVARAHLGEFGGIDNVAKAKSELVTGTREGGVVILNANDPRVRAMEPKAPGQVRFFAADSKDAAEVYATEVSVDATGHASFTLNLPGDTAPVSLALVGAHHVSNALAAAAVADTLGVPAPEIARILSETGPASPHRMDVFTTGGVTVIDDSYNANPDSMRAGLSALASLGAGRRKIAMLGAMLELGEESGPEHAGVGRFAAEHGIDVVIGVGPGLGELIQAAADPVSGSPAEVHSVPDVAGATALLTSLMRAGDVVLLKGSNGSGVWRAAEELKGK